MHGQEGTPNALSMRDRRGSARHIHHITLPIRQLGCASAAPAIEQALRNVPGVTLAYVNPVTEMAYVRFEPEQCSEPELRATLDRAGYAERSNMPSPPRAQASRWSTAVAWLRSRIRRGFGASASSRSSNPSTSE